MRIGCVLAIAFAGLATAATLSGATAARTVAAPGCKLSQGKGGKVGELTDVKGLAFFGSTRMVPGVPLMENAVLCTGTSTSPSQISFVITKKKTTNCTMHGSSQLSVFPKPRPGPNVIVRIRLADVSTTCGTDGSDTNAEFEMVGGARALMKDPLFAIQTGRRRTTLKVKRGVIALRKGRNAVTVGAGQQSTVPQQGAPQDPVPLKETPAEKAAFREIGAKVPKPDFSRPDPNGSAALKRIFANEEIGLGIASDAPTDDPTDLFVSDYFEFLAGSWRVTLIYSYDGSSEVAQSLAADQIDVALATDPRPFKGFVRLPLFEGAGGSTWNIFIKSDKAFLVGLRNFIRASVDGGQYSRFYREAFGKEPSLEVLKPVLFG